MNHHSARIAFGGMATGGTAVSAVQNGRDARSPSINGRDARSPSINGRDARSPSTNRRDARSSSVHFLCNPQVGFREFSDAMREMSLRFFSRLAETDVHKRNLPHWGQDSVVCFVTFRLADSIPATKLAQWQKEKETWLRFHPEPWDEPTRLEYVASFPKRIEDWLDAGVGSCILAREVCRRCVADALEHFNGERYILHSYVIMPNHVHVLFEISAKGDLARTVHAWKSFTAHALNKITGNVGAVWQSEYFDRLIRDSRHYANTVKYIRKNWQSVGGVVDGGVVARGTTTGGNGRLGRSERAGRPFPQYKRAGCPFPQ